MYHKAFSCFIKCSDGSIKQISAVVPVGQDNSCSVERMISFIHICSSGQSPLLIPVSGETLQNLTCVPSDIIVFSALGNVYTSLEIGLIFLNVSIWLTHDSGLECDFCFKSVYTNTATAIIANWAVFMRLVSKSSFTHPHMTESKMDKRCYLSSACGRTFRQMGRWRISKC